jgi:hypothetical protein
MTPEQHERLPVYAQKHILHLESKLDALKRLLNEITNGGGDPHFGYTDIRDVDRVFLLPTYSTLSVFPRRNSELKLFVREHAPRALQVMAVGAVGLIVRPCASNVVEIEAGVG